MVATEQRAMLGDFTVCRLRFELEAVSVVSRGTFVAATLRGGFGHLLKRLACTWPPGDCRRCSLKHTCVYSYVFETSPPPGTEKLRGIEHVPRPYVIDPTLSGRSPGVERSVRERARTYAPGERFGFDLVLIGRAITLTPHILAAFLELGRAGLGREDGEFRLAAVHEVDRHGRRGRPIYKAEEGVVREPRLAMRAADFESHAPDLRDTLRVRFLTPTRVASDGRIQRSIPFEQLVRALLRRLSSLNYFHCGSELVVDFRSLIDRSVRVQVVDSRLAWRDQERFSGRQQKRIGMGGVVGTITYQAPDEQTFARYRPLLAAAEQVHVGKGCVMGLGKISVGE